MNYVFTAEVISDAEVDTLLFVLLLLLPNPPKWSTEYIPVRTQVQPLKALVISTRVHSKKCTRTPKCVLVPRQKKIIFDDDVSRLVKGSF